MDEKKLSGEEKACCKNHPDRESIYFCSKYKYPLCEFCARCPDPELYCKFRSSCIIRFLEKEKGGRNGRE